MVTQRPVKVADPDLVPTRNQPSLKLKFPHCGCQDSILGPCTNLPPPEPVELHPCGLDLNFLFQDSYVKTEVIDPAIRGTLNILKACLKSNTAKRFVFTSSISTVTAKDSSGGWLPIVDESCQTRVNHVLNTKSSGWVYVLSKPFAEEAAFQFAEENGIHIISVITTTVGGPFLTPTVPASIQVLLSPITGDPKLLPILASVNSRMGSIALVHIEDICGAHIFLMEHENARGRYICCTESCVLSELVGILTAEYPCSCSQRIEGMERDSAPSKISSQRIRDMGFKFNYSIQDIIHQTVVSCVDCGFLASR